MWVSDKGCLATSYELPRHKCLVNAKSPEHGLQIFIYRWYIPHNYVYMSPQSYCALGNTKFLSNAQRYICTFQLVIDVTKITNFWSQHHNLFLLLLSICICIHMTLWIIFPCMLSCALKLGTYFLLLPNFSLIPMQDTEHLGMRLQ